MTLNDTNSSALSKYRLIAELGEGGMAQVYLALASGPVGFNKLVVIKQIRTQFAEDPEFLTMFLDEARLAARLNHPNVVQTNEVGQDDGRYFICMEYLEGQPLNQVFRRLDTNKVNSVDRLTLRQQLLLLSETLAGLHHAHELCDFDGKPLQVVHRDISPHNIFVTYAGQVKVVDFGIAKAMNSSSETRQGVLKGKIGYVAPEQILNERVDRRADIFAVGMILWQMLAGRRMFKNMPDVGVLHAVVHTDLPSPRTVVSDIPPRLEAICMKALCRQREGRYATAVEMAADIDAALHELGGTGTLRDLGKVLERYCEAERSRIRALVEEVHAGTSRVAPVGMGGPRDGSGPRPQPLPRLDGQGTASVVSPAGHDPITGNSRPSGSSLTANMADAPAIPSTNHRTILIAAVAIACAASAILGVAATLSRDRQAVQTPSATAATPTPNAAATAAVTPTGAAEPGAVAKMRIESSPPGASVSEGGATLGKTPLDVPLDPAVGTRHLVVALAGYVPYAITQEPTRENLRVVVPLAPGPSSADPKPTQAPPEHRPRAVAPAPAPKPPTAPPSDINMTR